MNIFDTLFAIPITNLLVLFYKLLLMVQIPYALGFSVIFMTIFIKIVLYPLMAAQIKSAKKMQDVAPQLTKIREKYKDDKMRQQQEMMKLYKENDINPASGCLPVLIQFPILIGLYHSLTKLVSLNSAEAIAKVNETLYFPFLHIDQAWNTNFFGLPLSKSPGSLFAEMPIVIILPLLTAISQFVLSKMMMPAVSPAKKSDDFQSAIQTQTMFIFPVMIGWFSFTLPLGLSLYWITFTVFGILQQYQLVGLGGLTPWVAKVKKNGRYITNR